MAALMKIRVVYVFTMTRSAGRGWPDPPADRARRHPAPDPEPGGMAPADSVETAVAWAAALQRRDGPTALLLSRQNVAFSKRADLSGIAKGGYVLSQAPEPKALVIATGSEVPVALAAQKLLADAGVPVRVVSMPSTSLFDRQDADTGTRFCPGTPKVAVEAALRITGASTSASRGQWSASTGSAHRPRGRFVQALRLHRGERG